MTTSGCDDDFFLLGGNSITAVDLILRIEEGLQYRLPLTILAEAPTVRKLEARLERMTLGASDNTFAYTVGASAVRCSRCLAATATC